MADIDKQIENHDDIFNDDFMANQPHNARKTIRYIRNDLKVNLAYIGVLGIKKTIPSKLNDISTRGVSVTTSKKISVNKKLTVMIRFSDGNVFKIKGTVIRKCPINPRRYGIKFEKQENGLGDYLLKTQTDLVFK